MSDSRHESEALRRRLFVVSFEQFGYHTDTIEYCRHLRERYRITYLCLDNRLPRQELRGVAVLYCRRRPLGKAEVGLLLEASEVIAKLRPDVVFLRRTKFSFLLRLRHPSTAMVFDVRSGSVETNPLRRRYENLLLRFNSWFFRHITVISEGLASQLRLPQRARILPLAADSQTLLTTASRDELRLVCVGTFKNRRIERTVDALGRLLAAGELDIPVYYSIVGFGSDAERNAIRKAVVEHHLEDRVKVLHRLDHVELPTFLAEHNVGVAFTPQVPWFEHQPSTKVYEYLHSGLLCIATDNAANREVISENNGVLVDDTAEAFARGLHRIVDLLPRWRPQAVAESVQESTWERIVSDNLAPLLEAVQR